MAENGGDKGETIDLMRYDLMAQTALRQVVRMALVRAEREGLPGKHHFFIAIDTRHPKAQLSERLRKKYPEEMTIVIQHQFWNLKVHQDYFEVDLSFNNIPEKLVVPFDAVKGFFDPAVQFGLQFEVAPLENGEEAPSAIVADDSPAANGEPTSAVETNGDGKPSDKGQEDNEDEAARKEGSKIVSLDAFRKK